ncbi:MAG: alpha/beta hydrolase [Desulfobacteraceae bacterium]|nr:MAG: alpha/beta hydrolase [Desulfobacteraceae bacterium]
MTVSYRNSQKNSTNVRVNMSVASRIIYALLSVMWTVSKPLTKYLVRQLFFKPGKYKSRPGQAARMTAAEPFTVYSSGQALRCWKVGEGPYVVFDHGWAGRGIQFDHMFDPILASGYGVIFFDNPGHGDSQGAYANYFLLSNALGHLMTYLGNHQVAALVGHSLGAGAVINYLWQSKREIPAVLIAPALDLVDTLTHTFESYGIPKPVYRSLIREVEQETGHAFELENPVDLIQTLDSNLLIIHDLNDRAVPFDPSWAVSQQRENIRLIQTQGLGHIRILSRLEAITPAVEFIGSCMDRVNSSRSSGNSLFPVGDQDAENNNGRSHTLVQVQDFT